MSFRIRFNKALGKDTVNTSHQGIPIDRPPQCRVDHRSQEKGIGRLEEIQPLESISRPGELARVTVMVFYVFWTVIPNVRGLRAMLHRVGLNWA